MSGKTCKRKNGNKVMCLRPLLDIKYNSEYMQKYRLIECELSRATYK